MEKLEQSRSKEAEEDWKCQNAATIVALGGVARCIVSDEDYNFSEPCDACWEINHGGDFWEAKENNSKEYRAYVKDILENS